MINKAHRQYKMSHKLYYRGSTNGKSGWMGKQIDIIWVNHNLLNQVPYPFISNRIKTKSPNE